MLGSDAVGQRALGVGEGGVAAQAVDAFGLGLQPAGRRASPGRDREPRRGNAVDRSCARCPRAGGVGRARRQRGRARPRDSPTWEARRAALKRERAAGAEDQAVRRSSRERRDRPGERSRTSRVSAALAAATSPVISLQPSPHACDSTASSPAVDPPNHPNNLESFLSSAWCLELMEPLLEHRAQRVRREQAPELHAA